MISGPWATQKNVRGPEPSSLARDPSPASGPRGSLPGQFHFSVIGKVCFQKTRFSQTCFGAKDLPDQFFFRLANTCGWFFGLRGSHLTTPGTGLCPLGSPGLPILAKSHKFRLFSKFLSIFSNLFNVFDFFPLFSIFF